MTREDLINHVRTTSPTLTKVQSQALVESVFGALSSALAAGERVTISSFGTFELRKRKATTAINPRTKEKIDVPARKRIVFRPGKELRQGAEGRAN